MRQCRGQYLTVYVLHLQPQMSFHQTVHVLLTSIPSSVVWLRTALLPLVATVTRHAMPGEIVVMISPPLIVLVSDIVMSKWVPP